MSETETYNGWSNRETWAVVLYINNDQGWQEQVQDIVRDALISQAAQDAESEHDYHYPAKWTAGQAVREHFEELVGNASDAPAEYLTRDLFMALMDIGSLYRVDWDEIGAAFLADINEQDAQS